MRRTANIFEKEKNRTHKQRQPECNRHIRRAVVPCINMFMIIVCLEIDERVGGLAGEIFNGRGRNDAVEKDGAPDYTEFFDHTIHRADINGFGKTALEGKVGGNPEEGLIARLQHADKSGQRNADGEDDHAVIDEFPKTEFLKEERDHALRDVGNSNAKD